MSKAYADEQIRKKKEEEEQKQNQSQDQQKTQPKANEPVGTTSIPKDTKKEESKGTTPKTEHSTTMTQAKQDAQNRTVQRNVTGRTMETDTATRRQDFRTYEQKVHDLHMDTLFPGTTGHNYSNSMKASNSYYTPQREKYEARNSQNRAQTFSPADLPTAEEFRLSQMTDAERMQELMNNRDSMPSRQQETPEDIEKRVANVASYGNGYYPLSPEDKELEMQILNSGKYDMPKTVKAKETEKSNPFKENTIQDPLASSMNQIPGLEDYIYATPEDDWRLAASSNITDQDKVRREQLEQEGKQSSILDSFFQGVNTQGSALGMGLINKAKAYGDVLANLMYPETTPEEAYKRTMSSNDSAANRIAGIMAPGAMRKDLETYENYIKQKEEEGTLTQEDINRYNEMVDVVMRDDPLMRTKAHYKDELALNKGMQEAHPVANFAGRMVPTAMQTMAGGELSNAILEGLPQLSGVAGTAANDAIQLIQDEISDTLPNMQIDIEEGKSAGEVLRNAGINTVENYAANKGIELLGKAGSKILQNAAADRAAKEAANLFPGEDASQIAARQALSDMAAEKVAKEAAPEIAEQTAKEIVPEVAEQAVKSEAPEVAEQIVRNEVPEVAEQAVKSEVPEIVKPAADATPQFAPSHVNDQGVIHDEVGRKIDELGKVAGTEEINQRPGMVEAWNGLIEALDGNDANAINNAIKNFDDTAKANGVAGHEKILSDIGNYVNGTHNIGDESLSYTLDAAARIDTALKDVSKLDLNEKALKEVETARQQLNDWKELALAGEDSADAKRVLDNTLRRLNDAAKNTDGYEGIFGAQGKDGVRKWLTEAQDRVGEEYVSKQAANISDEEIADMFGTGYNHAKPANQVPTLENTPSSGIELNSKETRNIAENVPTLETPKPEVANEGNFLDDFAEAQPKPADNIPEVETPKATAQEPKIRQGRTNVFERSGITEEESKNIYKMEDYSYVPDTNAAQMERATNILNSQSEEDALKQFIDDFDPEKAYSPEENDAMMMLNQRIRDRARATTDPAEKARLYAQSKQLSQNAVTSAGRSGASLQGWSKWADTPEHVVDKGYGVLEDMTEKYMSKHKNTERGIRGVSDKIQKIMEEKGYKSIIDSGNAEKIAKLKVELSDAISEVLGKTDGETKKALSGMTEKEINDLIYSRSTREINRALDQFAATGSMGIKDSTLDDIYDIMKKNESLDPNSKEFVKNERQIYAMIANDISHGKSFAEKLDAWRYMSMLSSPATHLRNIAGNLSMRGVAGVKNNLAAVIESAADRVSKNGIDRTKSVLTTGDRNLVEAARKDALEKSYRSLSGNMYTRMKQGIADEMKTFDDSKLAGRALNKANDFISDTLSYEDELTKIDTYSTALAGYLKSNGFDESILDPEQALSPKNQAQLKKVFGKGNRSRDFLAQDDPERMLTNFMEDARAYAIFKAKEQTFNNINPAAGAISNFSKGLRESDNLGAKLLGLGVDVTIPFKNVPANVLNTAVAYSPAEFIQVCRDLPKLKSGAINASDFIDDLAKAITGTGGVLIGAMLAREGIMKVSGGKGYREKNYDKATGVINDSITIGKEQVKLSQLIPAAAPLIYGATIFNAMNSGDEDLAMESIASGLTAVADGVVDMTMLSGISQLLDSVKNADDTAGKVGAIASQVGSNLAGQFIPTLGGLINKGVDKNQREQYYSTNSGTIGKKMEQALKYNSTKIPGLQALGEQMSKSDNETIKGLGNTLALEPRIDSKGNEMMNRGDSALGRIFNGTLPLEVGEDQSNETDNKLRELANNFPAGDQRDKIFPYTSNSEGKFKNSEDENVVLDEKQWTEYKKAKGQMSSEFVENFLNRPEYEEMNDATKAELLSSMYKFSQKYNQHLAADGKLTKKEQELADVYEAEGIDGVINALEEEQVISGETSEIKGAGLNSNSQLAKDIAQDMADGNTDEANKKLEDAKVLKQFGYTGQEATKAYNRAAEKLPELSAQEFAETFQKIDASENKQIEQGELIEYLNANGIKDQKEAEALWDTYVKNGTNKIPVLENGEWTKKKRDKVQSSNDKAATTTTAKPTQTFSANGTGDMKLKGKQRFDEQQRLKAQSAQAQSTQAQTEALPSADSLPDADSANTWTTYTDSNGNVQSYNYANSKWFQNGKAAGRTDAELMDIHRGADANGNGKVTKQEAKDYLDSLGLSQAEKRAMWSYTVSTKAGNPY